MRRRLRDLRITPYGKENVAWTAIMTDGTMWVFHLGKSIWTQLPIIPGTEDVRHTPTEEAPDTAEPPKTSRQARA